MAHVSRITLFPIKSLDGVAVQEAAVLPSGGLHHDRRFAFLDAAAKFINGKHNPRVHAIRATFSEDLQQVSLRLQGQEQTHTFRLTEDRDRLQEWFRSFFEQEIRLEENLQGGFPDDLDSPGPTFVSTGTLHEVASWFPSLGIEEIRRRFRANIEIGGIEPWWEDRLYAQAGGVVPFRVGSLVFEGVNPCQRCVVPTRHPETADVYSDFARTFTQRRQATLPSWAARSRFDHFYRLAVNTRLAAGHLPGDIRVGDDVCLLKPASAIVGFYQGTCPDYRGRWLKDIWQWDNDRLEMHHDYIQVLFPNAEPSMFNAQAPLLDGETISAFKDDETLRQNLASSLDVMLRFYGLEYDAATGKVVRRSDFSQRAANWLNAHNHNHLRITRILHCLKALGLPERARAFFGCLEELYTIYSYDIGTETFEYWRAAAAG